MRAQTGQVLATVSAQGSGLDAVKGLAAEKSLQVLGRSAAKDLGEKVKIELAKKSSVQVIVHGVPDLNSLANVKNAILQAEGVKDIYTRSFTSGVAEMDVSVMTATPISIGESLSANKGLKVQVSNITQDSLEVQAQ